MEPEFTATAYSGADKTGDAAGAMVEVDTPQGTVVFETGTDGLTHVSFPNLRVTFRPLLNDIVLES